MNNNDELAREYEKAELKQALCVYFRDCYTMADANERAEDARRMIDDLVDIIMLHTKSGF